MHVVNALLDRIQSLANRLGKAAKQLDGADSVRAIHRFRVASRRLREPLRACEKALNIKAAGRIAARLRTARRILSEVRDIDVLSKAVTNARESVDGLSNDSAVWLEQDLQEKRRTVLRIARDTAAVRKVPELLNELHGLKIKKGQKYAGDRLLTYLNDAWIKRRNRLLTIEQGTVDDWHSVRLKVKKLRYLAEFCNDVGTINAQAVASAAKAMQDRLGAHHDHLFAVSCLAAIVTDEAVLQRRSDVACDVLAHCTCRLKLANGILTDLDHEWRMFLATLHNVQVSANGTVARHGA